MIVRALLISAVVLVTAGVAAPALAGPTPSPGGHGFCIGLSDGNPDHLDGVCVYIPTH